MQAAKIDVSRLRESARSQAEDGATTVFVAIDGAILWLTIFNGWLNGVIAEIARTGSRLV